MNPIVDPAVGLAIALNASEDGAGRSAARLQRMRKGFTDGDVTHDITDALPVLAEAMSR